MLTYLRNRYHPLWRLRRSRSYRALQKIVDFPIGRRDSHGYFYYAYWLRDLTQFLPHQGMEAKTANIIGKVAEKIRPTLFVDVGANMGCYSLDMLGLYPECKALLFEPDQANIRLIERWRQKNAMDRAELIPCAVSSECGEARFLVDGVSGATGSLDGEPENEWSLHHAYGMSKYTTVKTVSLDSLWAKFSEHQNILMKVDVEGSEHRVFAGAAEVLAKLRPVIEVECFILSKLLGLQAAGYVIYDLDEGGNRLAIPAENKNLSVYLDELGLKPLTLSEKEASFATSQ